MIKTYSLKKDGSKKLSQNFMVSEFACKDGSDKVLVDTALVDALQKIRDHFGKAVTINSAYRNAAYNAKIGGVSNSQHVKGTAADIVVQGVTPLAVAQYAEHIMQSSGGIGQYNGFTHIDTRANRSRWTNFGCEKVVGGFLGFAEPQKELTTVNDIVWELHHRGIVTNKSLWLGKLKTNDKAYHLAKKAANMTVNADKPKALTSVNDIVWELNHRGIMTDKKLWLEILENGTDLYWLVYKICNNTKNK